MKLDLHDFDNIGDTVLIFMIALFFLVNTLKLQIADTHPIKYSFDQQYSRSIYFKILSRLLWCVFRFLNCC
jgi:hypothetical protein